MRRRTDKGEVKRLTLVAAFLLLYFLAVTLTVIRGEGFGSFISRPGKTIILIFPVIIAMIIFAIPFDRDKSKKK